MAKKFYITTAIDYVNAKPHIGHAYEKLLADIVARWHRLKGEKVFFLTGTDENAQKNVEAAKEAGVPVKQFVEKNAKWFLELCKKWNISNDDFIRTTEQRHIKVAQEIFRKSYNKGDIYKGTYEGLYCQGCEAFVTEKDLVNGKCPDHNKEPVQLSEESYFFKLSKYKDRIIKLIEKGLVIPDEKAKEMLSRLKEEGLKDLSVSRTNIEWGIDCPIDKKHKIYVWFDALINYISGANKNWPADCHAVGKGINWFHSVIWPAMLISAGYELPKKVWVHGYLTVDGKKISKSLGNSIDPIALVEKYPIDSLRYFLAKEIPFENDGDFSETMLIERHNNELADKLGNLISRVSTLAEKYGLAKTPNKLLKQLNLKKISALLDNYHIDKALNEIFAFIDKCNEYTQNQKPWETHNQKVLYELADSIKAIAILLSPFMPETSEKIAKVFNFEISLKSLKTPLKPTSIKKAQILFQKVCLSQSQEPIVLDDHQDSKYRGILRRESSQASAEKLHSKSKSDSKQEFKNKEQLEGIITMSQISFNDFKKSDMRVAQILKAEDIEGKDKLYKLEIDLGKERRTIVAGIKQHYTKEQLKNKKIIVVVNLEPANLAGIESNGMLLAAVTEDHKKVVLIQPEKDIEISAKVQ